MKIKKNIKEFKNEYLPQGITSLMFEINEILNDNVKNDPSHTFFNSGNNNFIIKKLLDNKYEINNFE